MLCSRILAPLNKKMLQNGKEGRGTMYNTEDKGIINELLVQDCTNLYTYSSRSDATYNKISVNLTRTAHWFSKYQTISFLFGLAPRDTKNRDRHNFNKKNFFVVLCSDSAHPGVNNQKCIQVIRKKT